MNNRFMTIAQLEAEARQNLSSYEGESDFSNYEGDHYDGFGDDLVDFGGITGSFKDEIHTGKIYTLTITNGNAAVRTALLLPGYLYQANNFLTPEGGGAPVSVNPYGTIATGAFPDTANQSGLSAQGFPKSIEDYLSFLKHNPTRITGIKFSSSVAAQIDQIMTVKTLSPFRNLEDENISLAAYQDENTYKDKVVTVPFMNLQGDNQKQIFIPIVGNSTLTITIFHGATLNTSAALDKKAKKAFRNIGEAKKIVLPAATPDKGLSAGTLNLPALPIAPTTRR